MFPLVRSVLVLLITTIAAFLIEAWLNPLPLWVPLTTGAALSLVWVGAELTNHQRGELTVTDDPKWFIEADNSTVTGEEWNLSGDLSRIQLVKAVGNSEVSIGTLNFLGPGANPPADAAPSSEPKPATSADD